MKSITYSIHNNHFFNMTKTNNYVSNYFKKYNIGDNISLNDDIINIFKYHPNKNIIIENLDELVFFARPPYYTKALYYRYKNSNTYEDISWKNCIRNIFGKFKYDKCFFITQAFRHAIHYTKRLEFKTNNTIKNIGICDNCNIETNNIDIDHYGMPFIKILNDFASLNNIVISNIEYYKNKNNEYIITDNNIKNNWIEYHDNLASFRLLCKSCNSKFSCYNYKK